ncbi:Uncharacterised protein [BD1-7 clade bacterium]|uniref:Polymerase beta nucleotidyltransferase domain-containing protein n=1 Tax=BD1-7 clade bacterium TaxID=2029982 RepID=A0A5S9PIT3_9GAMM|nr:Uncharacterised protein [BD1-7 clade bacterium]
MHVLSYCMRPLCLYRSKFEPPLFRQNFSLESLKSDNKCNADINLKPRALLYGQPDKSFYLNEVVRHAAMGKGAITRELAKLTDAGLLTVSNQGNQRHYQANVETPIFGELKRIVQKTFGIRGVIQSSLTSILLQLEQAFIYGSIAKGAEHSGSDIDLMLVGEDLSYSDIMLLLESAETQLQRPINPTIYSPDEFSERLAQEQNFLTQVMALPRIDLLRSASGE